MAGELFGDEHAAQLEAGAIELIRTDQAASGDGSFMSHRLTTIERESPYYFTRLEADKAVVLSMNAWWRRRLGIGGEMLTEGYEESTQGGWIEPEHGAVMHRSPQRIASWSWRARYAPQGLCLPPEAAHFAEWDRNLGGLVLPVGARDQRAVVLSHDQALFDGGFVTWGAMDDRMDAIMPEGWKAPSPIEQQCIPLSSCKTPAPAPPPHPAPTTPPVSAVPRSHGAFPLRPYIPCNSPEHVCQLPYRSAPKIDAGPKHGGRTCRLAPASCPI